MNVAVKFDVSDFLRRMRLKWRRYAYIRTSCYDHADDLIQETSEQFVIYHRKGNVSPGGEEGYFVAILKHRIYHFYRSASYRERPEEPANLEFALSIEEDHAERLEMERFRAVVESVLAGKDLKGLTREAFGLVRIMGLSYSQAGKRLGCGKATICRNLEKADRIITLRVSCASLVSTEK